MRRFLVALIIPLLLAPSQASAAVPAVAPGPTATGFGGAIATVDATATRVGLDVLRSGGNAVDAAIAAAATLGVTEPFSSGIGGGGFLVFYNARTGKVSTIDGREAAPASMGETAFVNPDTGLPYAFQEARVSGISVGVPGTVATWQSALRQWGTRSLLASLLPAAIVARRGFPVDQTFRTQITDNAAAFSQFSSTSALYLPGGEPPRSVPRSVIPTWPVRTSASPSVASTRSTVGRSLATSPPPSRTRRPCPLRRSRGHSPYGRGV